MLNKLANLQNRNIKIEVSLNDLIDFAKYIMENSTQSEKKEEDELGGIELAMKVTGLSKQTIYQKVSKDQIPYIKKGRLYFRKSTLQKWIENDNLNF